MRISIVTNLLQKKKREAVDNYHNRTTDEVIEKPESLSLKINGEP